MFRSCRSGKILVRAARWPRGEVDLSYYVARDGSWRALGIGAPARRALVDADLLEVSDLAKVTRGKVLGLHGIGPDAIGKLEAAMGRMGIRFLG